MNLLTCKEVAVRLAVSECTVRRLIKSGDMKKIRAGRLVRVSEEELYDFIQRHKVYI